MWLAYYVRPRKVDCVFLIRWSVGFGSVPRFRRVAGSRLFLRIMSYFWEFQVIPGAKSRRPMHCTCTARAAAIIRRTDSVPLLTSAGVVQMQARTSGSISPLDAILPCPCPTRHLQHRTVSTSRVAAWAHLGSCCKCSPSFAAP